MPDSGLAEIGRYRILELVGEGAMGVVYRGVDTVLNRVVAVKVMSEAIARQEDLRERFLREAQAAGSLQHPNVVTIYDFGEVDGHLYIAMEYVQGTDLESILSSHEPLTLQRKLDIAIDVLNGLSYAHKRGIVHRDIKPANIRISEEGRAKIMDFGVAHLSTSTMTQTGAMMGTPSYMAPEQVLGGTVSAATDIFAFGSLLYELLTGRRPFDGATMHNVLFKVVSEEPPGLLEVLPGLPPALDKVVRHALAKEPGARYQDALVMANDLAAIRATLSEPGTRTATLSLRSSIETKAQHQVGGRRRRRRLLAAGTFVLIAATAAGATWLMRGTAGANAEEPDTQPAERLVMADTLAARNGLDLPDTASDSGSAADSGKRASSATRSQAATVAPHSESELARKPATTDKTASPRSNSALPRTGTQAGVEAGAAAASPPVTQRMDSVAPPPQQLVARDTAPTVIVPPPTPTAASTTKTRDVVDSSLTRKNVEPPPSPPPPAPPDSVLIKRVVARYERAMEARDITAMRSAYPGMTREQENSFREFFDTIRSLEVTLSITDLRIVQESAEAHLAAQYEYVTRDGQTQKQPSTFSVSLRREASGWVLISLR